jgi:hypothetical protein
VAQALFVFMFIIIASSGNSFIDVYVLLEFGIFPGILSWQLLAADSYKTALTFPADDEFRYPTTYQ